MGSSKMAAVLRGDSAASTEVQIVETWPLGQTGALPGQTPLRTFSCPVAAMPASVLPWNESWKVMHLEAVRRAVRQVAEACRASLNSPSFASAPLLQKEAPSRDVQPVRRSSSPANPADGCNTGWRCDVSVLRLSGQRPRRYADGRGPRDDKRRCPRRNPGTRLPASSHTRLPAPRARLSGKRAVCGQDEIVGKASRSARRNSCAWQP